MPSEIEIEVKIIGYSFEVLKTRLDELGADYRGIEYQRNIQLGRRNMPLPENVQLRIREVRREDNPLHIEMTWKEKTKSESCRKNEETTTIIADTEEMLRLLDKMGYYVISDANKTRERYCLNQVNIEFDTWDSTVLPYPYVEVEASEERALKEMLKLLRVPPQYVHTESIAQLVEREKNKRV